MTKKLKQEPDMVDGKLSISLTANKERQRNRAIRQNFERTLIEEYNYLAEDIAVDFKVKVMESSKN